ncbi:Probable RNA-directed DNA polymerase from transposon BS [Eumeta japonica]|uniref:Probable RNA-directed DNA polymerase from transposon BS n=1 Tax=Eumeta variegata TaxID=151549 RepID=A0A4C1UAS3_EUMVA|nr:Probable RNA-directed DNA polymerase from transposon BS [Eumeta japonica]
MSEFQGLTVEPEGKHYHSIIEQRILAVYGLVEIVLRCALTMNDFQCRMMQPANRLWYSIIEQYIRAMFAVVGIVLDSTLTVIGFQGLMIEPEGSDNGPRRLAPELTYHNGTIYPNRILLVEIALKCILTMIYFQGLMMQLEDNLMRKKCGSRTSGGTRTHNPRLRRPMPYPLGHRGERRAGASARTAPARAASSRVTAISVACTCFDTDSTSAYLQAASSDPENYSCPLDPPCHPSTQCSNTGQSNSTVSKPELNWACLSLARACDQSVEQLRLNRRSCWTSLNEMHLNRCISFSEVQTLVKSLKTKKAPGLDDVNNIAIKYFSLPLLDLLVTIFNACLRNCYFLTVWKEAVVIGIHKSEKLRNFPAMYSCFQQVLRLVEYISEDFKSKQKTVAVFFDIAKAFDREFLKASPSLPYCTPRTLTIFRLHQASNSRYRDNTALFFRAKLTKSTLLRLQRAIDDLSRWFRNWRIEVNPEKSAAIQFKYSTRKNRQIVDLDTPHQRISNANISWQLYYKYLGVTLDNNLHFKDHIECFKKNCNFLPRTARSHTW